MRWEPVTAFPAVYSGISLNGINVYEPPCPCNPANLEIGRPWLEEKIPGRARATPREQRFHTGLFVSTISMSACTRVVSCPTSSEL